MPAMRRMDIVTRHRPVRSLGKIHAWCSPEYREVNARSTVGFPCGVIRGPKLSKKRKSQPASLRRRYDPLVIQRRWACESELAVWSKCSSRGSSHVSDTGRARKARLRRIRIVASPQRDARKQCPGASRQDLREYRHENFWQGLLQLMVMAMPVAMKGGWRRKRSTAPKRTFVSLSDLPFLCIVPGSLLVKGASRCHNFSSAPREGLK